MSRLRTHLAEVAAPEPSAWSPPPGAIRNVCIHLTPLAPALEGRDLSDDARWRWMGWVTPDQVTRRVLMRLQRRADQISLRAVKGVDGVEVHDGPPPLNGCERLLAIIFDVDPEDIANGWTALMPSAEVERQAVEGATILFVKQKEAA